MELDVLKVECSHQGLPCMDEHWESMSYEDKFKELSKVILETKGYHPHRNSKMFRTISFEIKQSVSLENVIELSYRIKDKFDVKCFQVSIDRYNNVAYMLFVWLDDDYNSIVFSSYDWQMLSVKVLRYLNLPRPNLNKSLTRYFLLDAFETNSQIYRNQIEVLFRNSGIPGINYTLIHDALIYAEYMCKGEVK